MCVRATGYLYSQPEIRRLSNSTNNDGLLPLERMMADSGRVPGFCAVFGNQNA